jgi:hypothetical protein
MVTERQEGRVGSVRPSVEPVADPVLVPVVMVGTVIEFSDIAGILTPCVLII